MAKYAKRAKRRRSSRRRRSVGAVSKVDIQAIALGTLGAIAVSKLQQFLSKDPTKTTLVNIAPFAPLAVSIVVPMFVKNPMVKAAAVGGAIYGGLAVVKKFMPGLVGNFAFIPIVSGTLNKYRNIPTPVMNGVHGTPLPNTSVYRNSMDVVSGVGAGGGMSYNPEGSGAASPWN